MSCCSAPKSDEDPNSCREVKSDFDCLLWGSLVVIALGYVSHYLIQDNRSSLQVWVMFSHGMHELVHTMWWGIAAGILAVGLMHQVPREVILKFIGKPGSVSGILRAMLGGLLLDLCNHGILLVGMKLYERGASLGQVLAFLIASPWNSISVTLILVALIGLPLTGVFILASALIALVSGLLVDKCLIRHRQGAAAPDAALSWREVGASIFQAFPPASRFLPVILKDGVTEASMILRWVFFGMVLAAAIRALVEPLTFQEYFGPSVAGLLLTLLGATVIEVCSEGSTPIGADLVHRAQAPGNGFVFLMAGAATDYTEILALKETTKRWGTALLLPVMTVPQLLAIGYLLNRIH